MQRLKVWSGRTAPLTSKRCILYIYLTNIGTEYFKHGTNSSLFFQNAVCFVIVTYLVPVLFTFYIQVVLKLKKNNSGAKKLMKVVSTLRGVLPSVECLSVIFETSSIGRPE